MEMLQEGYELFLTSPSFAGGVGGALFWWGCLYLGWRLHQNGSLPRRGYLWAAAGWALLSTGMLVFFLMTGWEEAWQHIVRGTGLSWSATLGLASMGAGTLSSLLMLPVLLGGMGGLWALQLTRNPQIGQAVGVVLGLIALSGILVSVGSRQLFAFPLLATALLMIGSQQIQQQEARLRA